MIKKIFIISTCLVMIFSFSACSNPADFFTGSDEVEPNYTKSDTVAIQMETVRSLNPVISKDENTFQISKLIYESLFYFNNNLSLVNGLASDYSYDEGKTSVNINIKTNSYFSDGEKVTGADVKFSIESYMAAAAKNNTIYKDYVSNIKSVTVDTNNKYLIKVTFKNTRDVSMDNFTFPILPEHKFKVISAVNSNSTDFIPIGSGPYKVKKYNHISELKLTANDYYKGTKVNNTLKFMILPEKEDVLPLLEISTISIGFLKEMSRDTLIDDKKINEENFPSNEVEVIGYNFSKKNMANKKVRQAIAYAVDNQEINESAYYKNGAYSDTIYFPGYLGTTNLGDNYKYDLEMAAKLLKLAGFEDKDENGYLEDREGTELSIYILVNSQNQSRVIAAEAIKASLDKLQVVSQIVYASNENDYKAKLYAKNYDIFIGGIKINETYDLRSLLHSNYANLIGYSNENLDALLDTLKSGISLQAQIKTVNSIKEILIEELPYYCIVYKTYGVLAADSLQGNDNVCSFNNIYRGCENWYCQYLAMKTQDDVDSINEER